MKKSLFNFCIYFLIPMLFYSTVAIAQPDTWNVKTSNPGVGRQVATGFVIASTAYVGTGYDGSGPLQDFWAYDQTNDSWTQVADFGGGFRQVAVGFTIGSKGYVGTGYDGFGPTNDFWEYNPVTNIWTVKAAYAGTPCYTAVGFSIGTKGYIGTGVANGNPSAEFWEYDAGADSWSQKTNFGGDARFGAVGFSIGGKGYIGTGLGYYLYSDFWEFDPANDSWTKKADYPDGPVYFAAGFSLSGRGYIGTGSTFNYYTNSFYEYNPSNDNWVQRAYYSGFNRAASTGFSIGTKGYIAFGIDFLHQNDLWEYTPLEPCAGIPPGGTIISDFIKVCSGQKANLVFTTGETSFGLTYQWQSSVNNSAWTNISGANNINYETFPILSNVYFKCVTTCSNSGLSSSSNSILITLERPYRPTITYSGATNICEGGSKLLTANNNSHYLWSNGQTTKTIAAVANNYSGEKFWVVNPDSNNCISPKNSVTITAKPAPYLSQTWPLEICPGYSSTLCGYNPYLGSPNDVFTWTNNMTGQCIPVTTPGSYRVLLNGCPSIAAVSVTYSCTAPYLVTGSFLSVHKNEITMRIEWFGGCGVEYQLQYRKLGTNGWTTKTNNNSTSFIDIKGLKPGWFYECQVRSKCNTQPSSWTAYSPVGLFSVPTLRLGEEAEPAEAIADADGISDITLFPSPAHENLNINFSSGLSEVTLKIYNISGQLVMDKKLYAEDGIFNSNINVADLLSGLYLVIVQAENDRICTKFVKE